MTELISTLAERREEFDAHFALAKALEDRMMLDDASPLGEINLSTRHINTVKSGLLVHLYNVEEALMSQSLVFLGAALGAADPRHWTEHSLREWVRENIVGRISEVNEDGRVETVFQSSSKLISPSLLGPQHLRKPTGTWDDKLIATFIKRMNINFEMPEEIWRRIAPSPSFGDRTPLYFLAKRRNAIAHGTRSFEEGANDLGLKDIRELADTVLDYLECVAKSIHKHIDNNAHLVATE